MRRWNDKDVPSHMIISGPSPGQSGHEKPFSKSMSSNFNKKILECFSYHKLRSAWLSFLKLLDIDFENGFSCPDCPGDGPEIIICDGTSLSFQRRMWSWKNTEMPTKTSSKKKSGYV
jgi:hypothetical protein